MAINAFALPEWRRSLMPTGGPPAATAMLRVEPDDFEVSEDLGFEPSGSGDHDFLYVRKVNLNTDQVATALARHAGAAPRDVGYSGLKDRRAVTRQWFSVKRRPGASVDWESLDLAGVTVLEATRNQRKLKRGSHRANRFRILLRNVQDPDGNLDEALETIGERGVPNYFGEQRFGRGGGNIPLAESLFRGAKLSRHRRSMALSAARSLIFNDLLSERIGDGSWNRLLPGDVANLDGTNSVFMVDRPDDTLDRRVDAFDVHPTGPLWGDGSPASSMAVARLELVVAGRRPGIRDGLVAMTRGARRALRLRPDEFAWDREGTRLHLAFRLRRGAFATAVLREVVRVTNA